MKASPEGGELYAAYIDKITFHIYNSNTQTLTVCVIQM